MKKVICISLLILSVLSSCEWKVLPKADDEAAHIQIERYDRLQSRYLTTGDFSALQQMNTDYPIATRTLVEKMLQLGAVDEPNIQEKFLAFYQDSVLQALINDAEAEYANMEDLNRDFVSAFLKLRGWLPDLPIPSIYAQIGALDQSVVVGDASIGISLDKYMGPTYPLYKKYYSPAQAATMTRSYIVPDCLSFYLLSLYPLPRYTNRTQLEKDLHMGKVMWVVNNAIGRHFFKSDYVIKVENYMKRHPSKTVQELLDLDDYSVFIDK